MSGISVDATARTATAARELALADGHVQAFQTLMLRLVPRDQQANVPQHSAGEIAALVRNFEVESEKTSSVRYLATLTFRFEARAIRSMLREAGIFFAQTRSKPVLVLPVYRAAGLHLLWDKPNPWLEAWAALPPSRGLVPLIVPQGDLADIAAISAEQAVLGREDRLRAIAKRYSADRVILALATLGRNPTTSAPLIQVTLTRFDSDEPNNSVVREFTAGADAEVEGLMEAVARATAERIQEDWKSRNLLRFDRQNEIIVTVQLRDLEDWVAIQRTIARIAFVQSSSLISLSRDQARVRMRYLGDETRLKRALSRRGLVLARDAASWVLTRATDRGRGRNGTR